MTTARDASGAAPMNCSAGLPLPAARLATKVPCPFVMTVVSSLIFAVVMYLMMKVMIDRCAFHISMVKVFGYRTKEIKKLYLDGNFYVIAVGAAVCIPMAKKCMDLMFLHIQHLLQLLDADIRRKNILLI